MASSSSIAQRRVALGVAAAAAGLFVIYQTAVAQIADLPRPVAAQIPPIWPASATAMARSVFDRGGNSVISSDPERMHSTAQFINYRLPLRPGPYAAAGSAAYRDGDITRATRLYEIAKRQDPRNTDARAILARQYLADGELERAATEIFALAELRGPVAQLMMSVVRVGGDDPEFANAILSLVRERPQRADSFYRYLQNDDVDRPLSLRMFEVHPPRGRTASRFIAALIRRGRIAEALAIWRAENDISPQESIAWPRNAGFEAPLDGSIFGWRDLTRQNGRIAPLAASAWGGSISALAVTYTGGSNELLLRQVAAMPAGSYRWSIPYVVDRARGTDIALRWSVTCEEGTTLDSASITPQSRTEGTVSLRFVVPATDCRTQNIELTGLSGERRSDLDVQFRGIEDQGGA